MRPVHGGEAQGEDQALQACHACQLMEIIIRMTPRTAAQQRFYY